MEMSTMPCQFDVNGEVRVEAGYLCVPILGPSSLSFLAGDSVAMVRRICIIDLVPTVYAYLLSMQLYVRKLMKYPEGLFIRSVGYLAGTDDASRNED